MIREQFISLISSVVLPLFTGAKIVGEEESSPRDSEVAQGTAGSMLIKFLKSDDYRLIIKRNQPFKNNDIILVKAVLSELLLINSYNITEPSYNKKLQTVAIEKAICNSISEEASQTLLSLITEIGKWAERTYEGKNLTFGFIINENITDNNRIPNLHVSSLLKEDFIALLSDGKKSVLELDKNGYLISHNIFDKQKRVASICPFNYSSIAKHCGENKIGLTLLENGDMLLFKNYNLVFAKRRGIWNSYSHSELVEILSNKSAHAIKELRRAIYISALDVSFSGQGGCIAYLNKDCAKNVLNLIDIDDILSEEYYNLKLQNEKEESEKLYGILENKNAAPITNVSFENYINNKNCVKTSALKAIIGDKKFHQLHRKLREELISIDGATIVDFDGTIIAAGAIVKIDAGSTGGGRLAAAKTLSRFGVSLKISQDGIIQGFVFDKRQNLPKPIFTIG